MPRDAVSRTANVGTVGKNVYSLLPAVVVYVNHNCSLGPYLDSVRCLPVRFGPGGVNRVLREAVQALVDSGRNRRAVGGMLPRGNGKVLITGECFFFFWIQFFFLQNYVMHHAAAGQWQGPDHG